MNAANLDSQTVRRARLTLVLAAAAAFGLAYLLSAEFRTEVGRAAGILYRGDTAGLRDYILSFSAWAPVVSALLMVSTRAHAKGSLVATTRRFPKYL